MKKNPPSAITNRRTETSGFTLIELLVAMAITTIIITILVSITSLSLDTWNRSRSEIRAARQGKSMIDSMARDFESLVVRKGNNFEWLYAEANPPTNGPNSNKYTSPNAIDLVFFSAATDRYDGQIGVTGQDLGGDVSTIGYQLTYKDPIAGGNNDAFKTFVLYRKLVNPDETFQKLLGQSDLNAEFDKLPNAVDEEANFICENVYQFTITFHVEVAVTVTGPPATTKLMDVPITVNTKGGKNRKFKLIGSGITTDFKSTLVTDAQLATGRVKAVEVSLTVLTDFGLQQMRKRPSIADLDEFIAKNSYQYSKLIPVPGS